jgi:hypothetical protein
MTNANTPTNIRRQIFFWKAVKWYSANLIIGLLPLIGLSTVFYMSHMPAASRAIDALIYHDGIIIFVSCTLMGATIIDFHLGGFEVKGAILLAMYGFPTAALILLLLQYVLTRLNLTSDIFFNPKSPFIISILVISIVYSVLGKFYVFLREETRELDVLD